MSYLLGCYRRYLVCGGMPENVKRYLEVDQDLYAVGKDILNDIHTAYMNDMRRYVKSDAEANKIGRIYDSIPA